jgi:hypothetical protein
MVTLAGSWMALCGRVRSLLSWLMVELKTAKKGCPARRLRQCALVARFVPYPFGGLYVVVLFGIVSAIVAHFMEELWVELNLRRQADMAAHVLSSQAGRIHASEQSRPSRCTDRCVGPTIDISQRLGRQRINVRCVGVAVSIAAQLGAVVFGGEPQEVGTWRRAEPSVLRARGLNQQDCQQRSNQRNRLAGKKRTLPRTQLTNHRVTRSGWIEISSQSFMISCHSTRSMSVADPAPFSRVIIALKWGDSSGCRIVLVRPNCSAERSATMKVT